MWPAKQVAYWVNGCDKYGNPGPGRTRIDVAFYTALYSMTELAIIAVILITLVVGLI